MQRVGPLIGNTAVKFTEALRRLTPIATAFLLARDSALQSLKLLEAELEMAWIGLHCAIREGGQRLDTQVYTYDWPSVGWRLVLLLH